MLNQSPINFFPQIQGFSTSSTNFIQWNIQGISQKKQELVNLIDKEKPALLCIQENMLQKRTNFNIKNYNGLLKEGYINRLADGGVAIFIHGNIPFK